MTLFALVDKRKNKIIGSICYSNCNQQDMLLKFGDIKRQVGKKISFILDTSKFTLSDYNRFYIYLFLKKQGCIYVKDLRVEYSE